MKWERYTKDVKAVKPEMAVLYIRHTRAAHIEAMRAADKLGVSLNAFVRRAVVELVERTENQ